MEIPPGIKKHLIKELNRKNVATRKRGGKFYSYQGLLLGLLSVSIAVFTAFDQHAQLTGYL